MAVGDPKPRHAVGRMFSVYGRWKARCVCGWETNALTEKHLARTQLDQHISYMDDLDREAKQRT